MELAGQEGGPILECAFVLLVKYQLMIQQKSWKEKSLQMVIAAMKLKDANSLEGKL